MISKTEVFDNARAALRGASPLFVRRAGPLHRRVAERLSGRVLDIGCGSYDFAETIRSRAGVRYFGLDARRTENTSVVGDAHALPFADQAFDSIMSIAVFEHLRRPDVAAREVYRVLAPGGRFIIGVPFLQPLHEAPADFQRFTAYGLRELLERAGFVVDELEEIGGPELLIDYLSTYAAGALARERPGRAWLPRAALFAMLRLINLPAAWLSRDANSPRGFALACLAFAHKPG